MRHKFGFREYIFTYIYIYAHMDCVKTFDVLLVSAFEATEPMTGGKTGTRRRGSQTEIAGMILGLRPANERRRYKVTPCLIGWAQT